jgi:REP element-mobilizing transposase RayT
MAAPKPIYTPDNCRLAYRLTWSLSIFWHEPIAEASWFGPLKTAAEEDAVRLIEHRFAGPTVSQFLISTTPATSPAAAIRSVKGRLQHFLRPSRPNAFRRNYLIHSIGAVRREVVEGYVSSQLGHHRMADPAAQRILQRHQIHRDDIDLSAVRRSSYGQFVHNLHVVLVNDGRWMEIREDVLEGMRAILLRSAEAKGHLLSRAGLFADHLHLAIGCGVAESPQDVALGYMNNLAHAQGMRPVFQFGYYVGTFGEYDFGALRR